MFPGIKISPQISFYESEIHIESLINTKWLITLKSVHNCTIFLCSLDVGNIDDQSRGPSIKEKIIQLGIIDYLKLTCGPLNEQGKKRNSVYLKNEISNARRVALIFDHFNMIVRDILETLGEMSKLRNMMFCWQRLIRKVASGNVTQLPTITL